MANFVGFQQYATLVKEATWGVFNPTPTYLYLPVTSYGVQIQQNFVQAQLFTGLWENRHNRAVSATVSGQMALPLWGYHKGGKSIAAHVLDWALVRSTPSTLDSYSVDWAQPEVNSHKRHLGLRVNTLTLTAENQGTVNCQLDLAGKSEVPGSPQAIVETDPFPQEGVFSDVEFRLTDGATSVVAGDALEIRSMTLTVNNNLQTIHSNSYYPSRIHPGMRTATLSVTIFKDSDVYDLVSRASTLQEYNGSINLKIPHSGTTTGVYTTVNLDFDRMSFSGKSEAGGLNDLVTETLNFQILKPSSTDKSIMVTYGTSA
ncbi:MAG: hypothetical protein K2X29_05500 [Candidatus Obscuribacterales bacterium]|nr:hypothetical protein [Candidatus Obscuribacterales bacterium]